MVSRTKWLESGLNALEVNSTFYRLPSESLIKSLISLPQNIAIVIKAWKYITHMKQLKDIGKPWAEFMRALAPLRSRISAILVQLPPRFVRTDSNYAKLVELSKLSKKYGVSVVLEFRDSSWLTGEVYSGLDKMSLAVVGTVIRKAQDDQRWLGTMPAGTFLPPATNGITYTRVHGGRGYRGLYSKSELRRLKSQVDRKGAPLNYVFFNNYAFDRGSRRCPAMKTRSAALCNAVMFTELSGMS